MVPSPGRDPSDYCTILGRECSGVGQIPVGLAPAMMGGECVPVSKGL